MTTSPRIVAVVFTVASVAPAVAGNSIGASPQDPKPLQSAVKVSGAGGDAAVSALPAMGNGSGVIFGRVSDHDSSRPVAGAIVTLSLPGSQPIRIKTDGQGRFGFRNLPAGGFVLAASKPGWADGTYGRTRPSGPGVPIALGEGELASDVAVPMWRHAAITGMVTDELGEPVVGASVRVLRRELVGGRIQLVPGAEDETDDRGIYRISALDPGDYLVAVPRRQNVSFTGGKTAVVAPANGSAAPGQQSTLGKAVGFSGDVVGVDDDGRPLIYPTTFYPNAAAAAMALPVVVRSGEEIPAIDFRLRATPTVSVSGRLAGPDGAGAGVKVNLAPADADEMGSTVEWSTALSDEVGRFTINDVPPGRYALRAVSSAKPQTAGAASTMLWAQMALTVERENIGGVTVQLRPGVSLSGRVQFAGTVVPPPADKVSAIRLVVEPADSRPGLVGDKAQVDASGRFSTSGVAAGRYFLRVAGAPAGWTLQSAMVHGRDASDVAVELGSDDVSHVVITFTDRPSELSGQVAFPAGSRDAVAVLVFPADAAAWTGYGSSSRRMASTRIGAAGAFRVSGLLAGEYFVVAIPDRLAADWRHPAFLASMTSGAERVLVREGERVAVTLKLVK